MKEKTKDQQDILIKLGITSLNEMQSATQAAIASNDEIVLLSPSGTGKTLAFLLPIIASLDPAMDQVQVLILVPSRELAIQIEQVIREMGSGFKANAVYGGKAGYKDKNELKHAPAILIGTPGRIADHFRKETISPEAIHTLVLDEFDKSLEVGFEKEMREIVAALPSIQKKILTSATQKAAIPDFIGMQDALKLNFLAEETSLLQLKTIISPSQDKLESLEKLLAYAGVGNGIIFCNFKDTIQDVSHFLERKNIRHACFYGGMEQMDRERALIKFRNGTHRLLVATDLAARGIDVPEMDFIIHYQLPQKIEEFTHRNGRTARMNANGTAYILKWQNESLPSFIHKSEEFRIPASGTPVGNPNWETLYISGGRKDKISKGDIAGLFFKQGGLTKDEVGIIELKHDSAFIAVPTAKSAEMVSKLNNSRLKTKKVMISLLK